MIRAAAALLLFTLAACGVDGPPLPPEPRPAREGPRGPTPGVTISGAAEIGVVGSR